MHYASRIERLAPALASLDEARAVRGQQARDVIALDGDALDLATPQAVLAAAKASLELQPRGDLDPAGQLELRQAIVDNQQRFGGHKAEVGEVVVLPGARAALHAACQGLLDPGAAVLAPGPIDPGHAAVLAASGAELVRVPMSPDEGFRLDPERIAAALTPAVRAILLAQPGLPAGTVPSRAALEALAALCRRHDLWLISEESLAPLCYDEEFRSPGAIAGMGERTVVVSGLAKSHAMDAWRVGWLIGPPALVRHAVALERAVRQAPPGFVQAAAIRALDDRPEAEAIRARFRRRRDAVCRRLAGLPGLACTRPAGGLAVLLDVRRTGLDGTRFAERLLASEGVATRPGAMFGSCATGHVCLSLTVSDELLAEACNRIGQFAFRLSARQHLHAIEATAQYA